MSDSKRVRDEILHSMASQQTAIVKGDLGPRMARELLALRAREAPSGYDVEREGDALIDQLSETLGRRCELAREHIERALREAQEAGQCAADDELREENRQLLAEIERLRREVQELRPIARSYDEQWHREIDR